MTIHRWFTGFFLVLLMLAVLFTSAWLFSARSFQDHFASISGNGTGVVSTRAIKDAERQIAALEAQAAPDEMRVASLQRQIDDADAAIDTLVKQQNDGAKLLAGKVAALESKAQIAPPAMQDDSYVAVASRVERLEQTSGVDQGDVKPLTEEVAHLGELNEKIVAAEDSKRRIEADMRALQASLNDNRQRLLSQKTQFGDHFDQIETEIESLQNSSPLGLGARLAEIHPTFLSAMLVGCMGALGSLLYLFPAYIANRPGMEVTFDTTIVRTIFGMVVAFAFFIVYNLSIMLIGVAGTGGAQATDASQNPFTVAGLGIVAGIMGDDIAKWIHDRGAYLFKGSGDGPTLSDVARGAATRVITPTKDDLPSGGLVNPHGGPQDTP